MRQLLRRAQAAASAAATALKRPGGSRWATLWRGVAALVLVNAPFWWIAQSTFMSRALVNLDSVLAVGVMTVAPWAGLPLLLGSWALDGAMGQSLTFHFANPLEFMKSVRFVTDLDWRQWFDWRVLVIAAPFAISLLALRLVAWRRPSTAPAIFGLAAMLLLTDALNGSSLLGERDEWRWSVNLAGSPAATTIALQSRGSTASSMRELPASDSLQGMVDIPAWAARNPDGSILLVIVESLGAPVQAPLRSWLDRQVLSPTYDVERGNVPFKGSTTAGELRTLCQLSGPYALLDATTGERCLPIQLEKLGWQTAGWHGFARRMFDRERWWPHIGLRQQSFVDSTSLAAGPRCGRTFAGTCDAWLIGRAIEWAQPARRFAYVLTLNTHLPLAPTSVPIDLAAHCQELQTSAQACELIAALGAVLHETSRVASAAGRKPLLLIIGDHSPPFNDRAARESFRSDVVPAYVLRPRR